MNPFQKILAGLLVTSLALAGCTNTRKTDPGPWGGERAGARTQLPPYAAAGTGGMVVTEDSLATGTGVRVLRAGGNAVDAAVAAALALAVVFPQAGNLGGGGFMLAYDPGARDTWAVDFRETAPGAAHRGMYEALALKGIEDASTLGPLAAGIPGSPAGLYAAWKKGGSLPWRDLVTPAVRLARGGFAVRELLRKDIGDKRSGLERYVSSTGIFFVDGEVPPQGARLVQPDLARVLEALADHGPDAFYNGDIANTLVSKVREAGGIWTLEDLADYRPVFREPVTIALRRDMRPPFRRGRRGRELPGTSRGRWPGDWPVGGVGRRVSEADVTIVTMPPPSSGALVFAETLALMKAQRALRWGRDDPRRAVAFVEALRLAFADRNTQLADPKHMPVPLDSLIGPKYLRRRAALLPKEPPGDSSKLPGARSVPIGTGVRNTTHIVVIDDRGGTVSLTTTLNSLFGCKWVVPGTGIFLNNEMDDFDTRPGSPNIYGLVGTGVNSVRPGARMLSSMSPTIVMRNDEVWFALGARGGPKILTAILQVILGRWRDGMSLVEAVEASRIHHQWLPDRVIFEEENMVESLFEKLKGMGYEVGFKVGMKPTFGKVMAAERLGEGKYLGVTDPRTMGKAMAVTK
ncbi:MAG: gamma-glutamyltransferase [Candidatus Krumholzibacteriia bacterium]